MTTKRVLAVFAAATMAACGGGGDGASTTSGSTGSTGTNPTPTSVTKVSGTAATGAALANATVEAKCATGSGSATTAADGTFTLNIANAVRPCVLSVKTPSGDVLHSIVEAGSGTAAVANVTPLTELVTAAIAGGSAADFFNTFDANAQAKLTPTGISTAVSAVTLSLTGTVDLAGINPVTDTLVAANGNTAGNAQDQALDKLGEVLKSSGTTLAELSGAVAANPGGTAGPVQTLLQTVAATCSTLRSGKYFSVNMAENVIEVANFDAATMKLTYASDGAVDTFVPASDACHYTNADTTHPFELVVGKAGIMLVRDQRTATNFTPRVIVPAQEIPVEKWAGDWVGMAYGTTPSGGTTMVPSRVYMTFDKAGKVTAGSRCYSGQACNIWSAPTDFPVINPGTGGLATTQSTNYGPGYMISFMGSDGRMAMFSTRGSGFTVYTQALPMALPVVGSVTPFWDSATDGTGNMTYLTPYTNRVDSVDAATKTYTRTRLQDGRVDSWTADKPSVGMRYRAASPGAAESYGIRVGGTTGLSAVISANPNQNFYSLSVDRP